MREYNLNFFQLGIFCLLLTGCVQPPLNKEADATHLGENTNVSSEIMPNKPQAKETSSNLRMPISHLMQCNRDLESLHTVNQTAYRLYQKEYDELMNSSANFLSVKDDVSPEVAELARPRFQFALVNLCYRIKDALAQTLINQAGGR